MLDLIAPAARMLGDGWVDDTRTFTDVTFGLGILQQVVHTFGPTLAPQDGNRGSVVLVAAPSEQHTLGVHVLGSSCGGPAGACRSRPASPARN